MYVRTALGGGLVFFYSDAMRVGISIVADARNLSGDFRTSLPARDPELVAVDFFGDIEFGLRCSNGGQQVAEVAVQGLKPIGEANQCLAFRVQLGDAVVNVHHVRTFDEGVGERFVGWIKWVIN